MRRPSVLVIGAFWAGLVLAGSVRTGLWVPVTGLGAAVAGAIIGALVQKAAEGSNMADKYTVRLNDGRTVAIITEHHDIQAGDCVSVEQGKHANIRRVSPVMCQDHQAVSTNQQIHGANVAEAEECHAAKQELLAAETEQEAEVAYRKMRAFCEQ